MMVLECGCDGFLGNRAAALYQDTAYGRGMRAHNPTAKEDVFRCTICEKERGKPQRALSKREQKEQREAEKAAKLAKQEEKARR